MTPDEIRLHEAGMKYKLIYSISGLVLGLACILTGLVLGLAGVAGHTNFTASLLGLNWNMTDAAPGVVVFVVGVFMVWISRFKVEATRQETFQPTQAVQAQTPEISQAKSSDGGAPTPQPETRERYAMTPPASPAPSSITSTITYTSLPKI
jgi:hypothetical protein